MLEGIRVVDFSFYLPGPYATMRLADLGAEIIKVEPPAGDPARQTGRLNDREGVVFAANNRSKKSVVLDLKEEKARETALKLIETADVILESFRPGVSAKLGISYEQVKHIKSDIVYCSLSGYGQTGTMAHLGSHDLNYMALSGALAQLKDSAGRPVHPTNTFADMTGGLAANEAILAALLKKERTGAGTYIDLAIADVMASYMTNHTLICQQSGRRHGVSLLDGSVISYRIYETKDRRFVALAALERKFWENFCRTAGHEEWIPAHLSPAEEKNSVFHEISRMFASRTLAEWTSFGLEADCCLTPVLETGELADSPLFKERGRVTDASWGDRQVLTHPGPAKLHAPSPPPQKGEHTDAVTGELLKRPSVCDH